jgi:hypothetical protein
MNQGAIARRSVGRITCAMLEDCPQGTSGYSVFAAARPTLIRISRPSGRVPPDLPMALGFDDRQGVHRRPRKRPADGACASVPSPIAEEGQPSHSPPAGRPHL